MAKNSGTIKNINHDAAIATHGNGKAWVDMITSISCISIIILPVNRKR